MDDTVKQFLEKLNQLEREKAALDAQNIAMDRTIVALRSVIVALRSDLDKSRKNFIKLTPHRINMDAIIGGIIAVVSFSVISMIIIKLLCYL